MLGGSASAAAPSTYFDRLNLHPRIRDVSRELFLDGHHWDAVFAASKALLNFIQERWGRHDLDGTSLVRTVFSKNTPVLAQDQVGASHDRLHGRGSVQPERCRSIRQRAIDQAEEAAGVQFGVSWMVFRSDRAGGTGEFVDDLLG
jgi:Protein of unknown function (Hypoth_ymh)